MTAWTTAPLGELCRITGGGTPSRTNTAYFGGGIPWVKIGDMLHGHVTSTEETISSSALQNSAAKLLPPGTVLISIFATIGRTAVLGVEAATNQAIAGIIPLDPSRLSPEYLRQFLDSVAPSLERRARGVAQANINFGILKALPIPLPPSAEQGRIAEVLDRAGALRAKRRAALAQLDTLTQSIFLDMFGDPAVNPKGWPRAKLGELMTSGPQNGLYRPASDYGSGTPILRIDAFYDGTVTKLANLKRVRVNETERDLYSLRSGDVVVNRVNSMEYLGKSALIPNLDEPTVFESNMMRFGVDHDRVDPLYVVEFLQTKFIKKQILTSAKNAVNQSSINQQDVNGFVINVPGLSLQCEFALRIAVVEKLRAIQRASLASLDALFASLQHRAFRGEL